jgi:hypothetical protein
LLCREGNERLEGYEGEEKDELMVTWGSPFVPVAFKTLCMFNIFLATVASLPNIF